MKKILIPTRCTEHSVHLLRLATKLYGHEGFHCTFLQVVPLPDNEVDLMMLGREPSGYVFAESSLNSIRKIEAENKQVIKGYSIDKIYGGFSGCFQTVYRRVWN